MRTCRMPLGRPEAAILDRVRETMRRTGLQLRPKIVRGHLSIRLKRRLVSQYRTQITDAEATAIAAFATKYRGGERIWVPRHSSVWTL